MSPRVLPHWASDLRSRLQKSIHRVSTLSQSLCQDVIYAVTCGQHKPPKQLPYAVTTLTGNIKVIRPINKFGHIVIYSQLEENDSTHCLQKLV